MKRIFAAVFAAIFFPGCTSTPTVDGEALFQERLAWAQGGGDLIFGVDHLTPQERVRGGRGDEITRVAPGEGQLSQDAIEAAIAYARETSSQALLVWHGGRLQIEWYGEGYDALTRSSTQSMMKPLMALALGAAIADGRIGSVDDPVGRYISEWANDPRGAITIRQILRMESGLEYSGLSDPNGAGLRHTLGPDIVSVALATAIERPAGEEFQYNGVNSSIGGIIIERATGMRYAEWLSRSIWRPIGARDGAVWLDRPGGFPHTECCMIATAEDWLRVGLLIRNHGRVGERAVVPAEWIREMTAASPTNPNFGYQMWRASPYVAQRGYGPRAPLSVAAAEPFLVDDFVFFDGWGGQRVYVSDRADLVIIRIGAARFDWDDSRLPNIVVRGLQSPSPS